MNSTVCIKDTTMPAKVKARDVKAEGKDVLRLMDCADGRGATAGIQGLQVFASGGAKT